MGLTRIEFILVLGRPKLWNYVLCICIYVLKSLKKDDFIYVGYSENLKRRFQQHNSGLSSSTKPYIPFELIFYEAYKNKKDAKRREKYLKTNKGRKVLKLMLQFSLK